MTDKPVARSAAERTSWNDHYMLLALIAAQRSPDPNTQVGAVVVDNLNQSVGIGYNKPPIGIRPSVIPWDREGDLDLTKYAYIRHAEQNAISNVKKPVTGYTLYVTMHPCDMCARDIIQAGIKEVFYLTNPYHDKPSTLAAKSMLNAVDIPLEQFEWTNKELIRSITNSLIS